MFRGLDWEMSYVLPPHAVPCGGMLEAFMDALRKPDARDWETAASLVRGWMKRVRELPVSNGSRLAVHFVGGDYCGLCAFHEAGILGEEYYEEIRDHWSDMKVCLEFRGFSYVHTAGMRPSRLTIWGDRRDEHANARDQWRPEPTELSARDIIARVRNKEVFYIDEMRGHEDRALILDAVGDYLRPLGYWPGYLGRLYECVKVVVPGENGFSIERWHDWDGKWWVPFNPFAEDAATAISLFPADVVLAEGKARS